MRYGEDKVQATNGMHPPAVKAVVARKSIQSGFESRRGYKGYCMDDQLNDRLVNVLESFSIALANGIQLKLNDMYGGTPHIDVDLSNPNGNLQVNVSGMIDIRNGQTRLQEYNQMLNTILEVRRLPDYSKKLLKDKMEVEETIDNRVKLIQKETEKESDRRTGHERQGN